MAGATKLMTPGGGGVTIRPASSITSDVVVQVPSQNCTLGIQGPAFSAYQGSAQSFAMSTETKIQYNTEVFDTASCYDPTTNYRFTPNVAGYYFATASIGFNLSSGTCGIKIYKNGSNFCIGQVANNTGIVVAATSCLVYMNGTTDYLEVYGRQDAGSGTQNNFNLASLASFSASLVRAA